MVVRRGGGDESGEFAVAGGDAFVIKAETGGGVGRHAVEVGIVGLGEIDDAAVIAAPVTVAALL